jgi:hypothetical protein
MWQNRGGIALIGHNFFSLVQQREVRITELFFQREDISTNLGRKLELSLYYRFGNLEVGGAKPVKRLGNGDLQGVK